VAPSFSWTDIARKVLGTSFPSAKHSGHSPDSYYNL